MKRLLLLAVLMMATAAVTAQDLKLADRVIRVDDVYEGYELVATRCGHVNMGFGNTPPVARKYYPGYNASEKWTLYPTDAGTFRRIVIEFIGEWAIVPLLIAVKTTGLWANLPPGALYV